MDRLTILRFFAAAVVVSACGCAGSEDDSSTDASVVVTDGGTGHGEDGGGLADASQTPDGGGENTGGMCGTGTLLARIDDWDPRALEVHGGEVFVGVANPNDGKVEIRKVSASGGTPTVLMAADAYPIDGLVADADALYTFIGQEVRKVSRVDGSSTTLFDRVQQIGGIILDQDSLYIGTTEDPMSMKIYKIARRATGPGTETEILSSMRPNAPQMFALSPGKLWFTDGNAVLFNVDLPGPATSASFENLAYGGSSFGVATTASYVFATYGPTNDQKYGVARMGFDESGRTDVYLASGAVRDILADSQRLYWAEYDTEAEATRIAAADEEGANVQSLATGIKNGIKLLKMDDEALYAIVMNTDVVYGGFLCRYSK